jgi:hypothetical protein
VEEYYWDAATTKSNWAAESVSSIIPGFGMLANSHTGLVDLENFGCLSSISSTTNNGDTRNPSVVVPRQHPTVGAASECQVVTFRTTRFIPAGYELYVEYGDEWFKTRPGYADTVSLSTDYEMLQELSTTFLSI